MMGVRGWGANASHSLGEPTGNTPTGPGHAFLGEPEGCGAGLSVISTCTSEAFRALLDPQARSERRWCPSQGWRGERALDICCKRSLE